MSHRPREDEPIEEIFEPTGRRPGRAAVRRPDVKRRIVEGLRVIQGGGDPDEITRCLAKGKIVAALGRVLVDGQLPERVEK